MAAYRMTPARRAALEKAQAASAAKRRRLGNKSRTSRLANRKTLALTAIGSVGATVVVANTAGQMAATQYRSDTDDIRKGHLVELQYEALLERKRREYEFLLKRIKKIT